MRLRKLVSASPALFLLLAVPISNACAIKSDASQASGGCDEITAGSDAVGSLSIDAKVKAFAQATAELKTLGDGMRSDVKTACIHIATDLGETDRWSNDDSDDAIANDGKTGACDVAAARVSTIMTAGDQAGASFGLEVSGGECAIDADVQATCEKTCQTDTTCTEPPVEKRCSPAKLSGECNSTCMPSAACEGLATAIANCQGKCDAECDGTCAGEVRGTTTGGCTGTCEGTCDGVATPAGGSVTCTGTCEGRCTLPAPTATCHGKCEATCVGTCKGECVIAANAGLNCGPNVACRGGCAGTYVAPKCEEELAPPVCTGDTDCQTNCAAQASASATCTAPSVTLIANVAATPDIPKLKATLEANLSNVFLAAQTKGQLAARALTRVAATGQAVINDSSKLSGKDIACAAQAASISATAAASMSISVKGSSGVATTCTSHEPS